MKSFKAQSSLEAGSSCIESSRNGKYSIVAHYSKSGNGLNFQEREKTTIPKSNHRGKQTEGIRLRPGPGGRWKKCSDTAVLRDQGAMRNPYENSVFQTKSNKRRLKVHVDENSLPPHLIYWQRIKQPEIRDKFLVSYTSTYKDNIVALWTSNEVFSFLADAIVPSEAVRLAPMWLDSRLAGLVSL